jgi:glutathione peroxidase
MLANCAASCAAVANQLAAEIPESFYHIVEKDIYNNDLAFDQFRGFVVYITNVASYCGYTEENYELFRRLAKYKRDGLVVIIAPCNQFGFQEPGDSYAITKFADKNQFDGIILSKADVNGHSTRPAFLFLKAITNRPHIQW